MLTLQRVRARSAQELQPLLKQISKTERAILGALEETYIMSAIKEKLSTRARDTYACTPHIAVRGAHTTAAHSSVMTFKVCRICIHAYMHTPVLFTQSRRQTTIMICSEGADGVTTQALYTAIHTLHLGRCVNGNHLRTYKVVGYIQQHTNAFAVGFAGFCMHWLCSLACETYRTAARQP